MAKIITTLSILLFTISSFAQHVSCDGTRYLSPTFSVDTTVSIQFGNGTTVGGANQDLFLDFFEPAGDVVSNRPLIILAFGGSFIGGTREDMHSYCAYYTSMGYATATIDYRLYDVFGLPDSITMTDVVMKSVSDMKAAIRFFREDAANANLYKIDTNLIFVGGISAGGIVANHAGLLQSYNSIQPYIQTILDNNGGWTGNSSSNTQYGDQVTGILNFSGALKWASYIDPQDPPFFSVHDDQDGTVPYGTGDAVVFGFPIITMEGSQKMNAKGDLEGVQNELITIPNSTGHVSYFGNQVSADSILTRSLEFLYSIVCNQPVNVEANELGRLQLYPNPTNDWLEVVFDKPTLGELRIYNVMGQVVHSNSISEIRTSINLRDLPSGNYWLKVFDENGSQIGEVESLVKE